MLFNKILAVIVAVGVGVLLVVMMYHFMFSKNTSVEYTYEMNSNTEAEFIKGVSLGQTIAYRDIFCQQNRKTMCDLYNEEICNTVKLVPIKFKDYTGFTIKDRAKYKCGGG